MRGKWVVYALLGWLPGLDLAVLDVAEDLRRHDPVPVVRDTVGPVPFDASPARPVAIVDEHRRGLTVEGRQFLVWDEDPRTAEQWAAELRPFDR